MTTVEQSPQPSDPAQELPDYLTDPNAVLKDSDAKWRYGRAPDYSKTRDVFAKTKRMDHAAGSLPQLVENLVKNWEVEASFKPVLSDWRTVDHDKYTFAINGGPPQGADHMLKVGTYNAIIAPNDYYSPEHSDFASSHKTFKRMMPTFAWEVLEVYSGPPVVAFRWRHWGTMKNDYVGFNDKGEKITSKAHGGSIDIEGVTIAHVDNKVRLQKVETWFDPMEMFRQIAPTGVVNRVIVPKRVNTTIPFNTQPAPESDEKSTSPDLARRNSIDSQSTLVVSPQISKQEEDVDEDEFHEAHTSHNLDKHSTDPEVLVIHSTINEENAESDATSTEVVPPEDGSVVPEALINTQVETAENPKRNTINEEVEPRKEDLISPEPATSTDEKTIEDSDLGRVNPDVPIPEDSSVQCQGTVVPVIETIEPDVIENTTLPRGDDPIDSQTIVTPDVEIIPQLKQNATSQKELPPEDDQVDSQPALISHDGTLESLHEASVAEGPQRNMETTNVVMSTTESLSQPSTDNINLTTVPGVSRPEDAHETIDAIENATKSVPQQSTDDTSAVLISGDMTSEDIYKTIGNEATVTETPVPACSSRRSSSNCSSWTRISHPDSSQVPTSLQLTEHDHEIQDDEDASIKQRVQESSIPETSNLYKDGEYDDVVDQFFDCPSDIVRPYSKDMEQMVHPHHGEAVAVPASSEEARATHEEMSRITRFECPFLMNRE